jgi:hypothetical protein
MDSNLFISSPWEQAAVFFITHLPLLLSHPVLEVSFLNTMVLNLFSFLHHWKEKMMLSFKHEVFKLFCCNKTKCVHIGEYKFEPQTTESETWW